MRYLALIILCLAATLPASARPDGILEANYVRDNAAALKDNVVEMQVAEAGVSWPSDNPEAVFFMVLTASRRAYTGAINVLVPTELRQKFTARYERPAGDGKGIPSLPMRGVVRQVGTDVFVELRSIDWVE